MWREGENCRAVLEDAEPVLDAARRRYEQLLKRAPSAELLREAAIEEPRVERLLTRLEGSREGDALRQLQRRVKASLGDDLVDAWLARLRHGALVKRAMLALPASEILERFARALEAHALDAICALWPAGEAARRDAWARLDVATARHLRKRDAAGSLLPSSGPGQLVSLEAARAAWMLRAQKLAHQQLAPLPVRDDELAQVVRWLASGGSPQGVERAPLLELARALNRGVKSAELLELARRADACGHPDSRKLLERLRVRAEALHHAREPAIPPLLRTSRKPGMRAPESLEEALALLHGE